MYNIFAQAVGFVAMAFCVSSYQIRNSRMLILWKAAGDVIYIVHYLLLGAYSGCTTVAICALNGLLCGCRGSRWAEWKGWKWLLSALLVAACLLTWRKAFDPFPSVCTLVSILVVIWTTWSGKARVVRLGKLFGAGPTWLAYTVFVRSYSGALCELVGMASAAVGLWRYGIKKSEDEI